MTFRTRLALWMTGVFVLAGAGLLVVQNLLLSEIFDVVIAGTTATLMVSDGGLIVSTGTGPEGAGIVIGGDAPVDALVDGTPVVGTITMTDPQTGAVSHHVSQSEFSGWFGAQSMGVAADVQTTLMWWSLGTLAGFAVVAALLAWWLARRSMRRIGEVTTMAQSLSTQDLHQRLDLAGPADEIKELADTFDGMLDRLQDAFARQDRFVANASHELRTPLTTARTALEIPLAQGRVPEELQPALETALRAGQRSEALISSLLVLARGATVDEAVDGDLAEITAAAVHEAQTSGPQIHLSTEPAPIRGEPIMIGRAAGNLIDNALAYNEPGGRVWVTVKQDNGFAVLEVANTGPELTPEEIDLLGEPFYRAGATRTARRSGGSAGVGLGLSIVTSIVHAHRGTVAIAARDGGGLRVTVRLPLAARPPTCSPIPFA